MKMKTNKKQLKIDKKIVKNKKIISKYNKKIISKYNKKIISKYNKKKN